MPYKTALLPSDFISLLFFFEKIWEKKNPKGKCVVFQCEYISFYSWLEFTLIKSVKLSLLLTSPIYYIWEVVSILINVPDSWYYFWHKLEANTVGNDVYNHQFYCYCKKKCVHGGFLESQPKFMWYVFEACFCGLLS